MFPVLRLFFAVSALLAAFSALAEADPAARVGRIALLDGPTLFRTDRDDAGNPASLNWPISSGAILDTETGSRAEVWIGSTAYRLAGDTRLEFANVDDRRVTLHQASGTLAITVRDRDQADDIEVRTPNGQVRFGAPGRYRIDVGGGRTNVAAASGIAYVYGDRTITVDAGRTASIDPNGAVALYGESLHDGFDDWVAQREAATRPRVAQRYVSPAMTGYQDLDRYGDWGSVPDYGTVWYPRAVPIGWAPYRYGRWAWIPPWGWTWVDEAPWGFAPFHYGRWVEVRGRWGWVPGAYVARPVYAPALVAWIGNPGWSVSLSVGSGPAVGWFPLAPREVYVPAYRASPTYIRQVNVTQVTNVTVINRAVADRDHHRYVHRDSPRAVTVVPVNAVREGAPVRSSAWSGRDRAQLREAPVSARAPAENWLPPPTGRGRGESAARRENEHGRPPSPSVLGTAPGRDGRAGGGEPRPLPPNIDRLPAAGRDAPPVARDPRPLPPSIDRQSGERRQEPPAAVGDGGGQPRRATPTPAVPPGFRETPGGDRRFGERRNEPVVQPPTRDGRPAAVDVRPPMPGETGDPGPSPRRATPTPAAPAGGERFRPEARSEDRPRPVEVRPAMPERQIERRSEHRPAEAGGGQPPWEQRGGRPQPGMPEMRAREAPPPVQPMRVPQPAAVPMPTPGREASSGERRMPGPEARPGGQPRDERQNRGHDKEDGQRR